MRTSPRRFKKYTAEAATGMSPIRIQNTVLDAERDFEIQRPIGSGSGQISDRFRGFCARVRGRIQSIADRRCFSWAYIYI